MRNRLGTAGAAFLARQSGKASRRHLSSVLSEGVSACCVPGTVLSSKLG